MIQGSIDTVSLRRFCRAAHFEAGEVLRHKGQHYRDMFVLVDGSVGVDRQTKGGEQLVITGSGAPVGEIGFLCGVPATATVTTKTATCALVLDASTRVCLEQRQPALAAKVIEQLASIADKRTSDNRILDATACSTAPAIDVLLCQNHEMLESAQRLRYAVYCEELKRRSPYADPTKRIITDDLDKTGHTFVAVEKGETIGTVRLNISAEGPLGILEQLYGMQASKHHPEATAVCTKFIVKKSKRGGLTSLKLISAVARYGVRNSVKEAYIDCVPALLPYYRAIGFEIVGDAFVHQENGLSYPMVLDAVKHGRRLSNEGGKSLSLMLRAQFFKLIGVRRTKGRPPAAGRER